MTKSFKKNDSGQPEQGTYFVTCRMHTGAARFQANGEPDLSRLLGELRQAGAWDITAVDADGKLVLFDPSK